MIWIKNYLAKMTLREMITQMEQQEKTVQAPTLTNMQHSWLILNSMLILMSNQNEIKQAVDTKDFRILNAQEIKVEPSMVMRMEWIFWNLRK